MINPKRNITTPNSSFKLPKIASPDPFPKINPVYFPIGIVESVAYAFFLLNGLRLADWPQLGYVTISSTSF